MRIFRLCLNSVSTSACLQLPQGVTGSDSSPSLLRAAIAIATIGVSGNLAPAVNRAVRSAQIVTENAAFSWLHPDIISPFSSRTALPTWK